MSTSRTVVFFDGVCGLCDRLVRFLLVRDRRGALRFATLQGELAGRTLPRYGLDPSSLDSVVVVTPWNEPGERALTRAPAVLHAVGELGGVWRVLASAARVVPAGLANRAYTLVARTRYRVFGRFDACPLPPAEWRDRFLD